MTLKLLWKAFCNRAGVIAAIPDTWHLWKTGLVLPELNLLCYFILFCSFTLPWGPSAKILLLTRVPVTCRKNCSLQPCRWQCPDNLFSDGFLHDQEFPKQELGRWILWEALLVFVELSYAVYFPIFLGWTAARSCHYTERYLKKRSWSCKYSQMSCLCPRDGLRRACWKDFLSGFC